MLSTPAALPFFRLFSAFWISILVIPPVWMLSGVPDSSCGGSCGGGRFSVSLKCSFHLASCSSTEVRNCQFLVLYRPVRVSFPSVQQSSGCIHSLQVTFPCCFFSLVRYFVKKGSLVSSKLFLYYSCNLAVLAGSNLFLIAGSGLIQLFFCPLSFFHLLPSLVTDPWLPVSWGPSQHLFT